jgi:multifunctional beta-oxidation protein
MVTSGRSSTQDLLETSKSLESNPKGSEIDFKGKTVIITGAGAGLGRIYALMFGKMGANVVVNDVSKDGAQSVVEEVVKGEQVSPHVKWMSLVR